MNVLTDMHSHSSNSCDAQNTVDEMVQSAIDKDLRYYAITDHVECHCDYWTNINADGSKTELKKFSDIFSGSMNDIEKARLKYKGKINLICGVELGQSHHRKEVADKYAEDKRLDFVIASNHQIRNHEDFYYLDYSKENIPQLLEQYFNEIYEICLWNKFDVLGHLTYMVRYITGVSKIKVDLTPYDEIVMDCFRILAQNGKGIEVNTSGLRQGLGFPFPSLRYIKMFKEAGGEIITVGSDSHCTGDVGSGIEQAYGLIKEAGFKYISVFEKHKPELIKIK